ncbi:unnamed protein product, partial [Nesidiocoris tenuis]
GELPIQHEVVDSEQCAVKFIKIKIHRSYGTFDLLFKLLVLLLFELLLLRVHHNICQLLHFWQRSSLFSDLPIFLLLWVSSTQHSSLRKQLENIIITACRGCRNGKYRPKSNCTKAEKKKFPNSTPRGKSLTRPRATMSGQDELRSGQEGAMTTLDPVQVPL